MIIYKQRSLSNNLAYRLPTKHSLLDYFHLPLILPSYADDLLKLHFGTSALISSNTSSTSTHLSRPSRSSVDRQPCRDNHDHTQLDCSRPYILADRSIQRPRLRRLRRRSSGPRSTRDSQRYRARSTRPPSHGPTHTRRNNRRCRMSREHHPSSPNTRSHLASLDS